MRVCQKNYSANKVNSFIPDIDVYYHKSHTSLWGGVYSNSVNLSNNDDIKFKSAYILQGVEVGFKLYV